MMPDIGTVQPGRIVLAGHICLDVIPDLSSVGWGELRSGALDIVGPFTLWPGGCVANTGIALQRLGVSPLLVARIGTDPLAGVLQGLVTREVPEANVRLVGTPTELTGHTLVLSWTGRDRVLEHFPGANDEFVESDVTSDVLRGARLLHVGYPPLLRLMSADDGAQLKRLFARAHEAGVMTSLDMAAIDVKSPKHSRDWRAVLANVLPEVDVFLPSLSEAIVLGDVVGPTPETSEVSMPAIADLVQRMLDLGVAIAGMKLGERGLYVRTASGERLARTGSAGLGKGWADRELHAPVFEVEVAGTTGAGDATIAGFLLGLLAGMSPEDTMTAASAAGAASVEAVDASSGIGPWSELRVRIEKGWPVTGSHAGPGWQPAGSRGVWCGPLDRPNQDPVADVRAAG
jgi:sugar/nucleoside kinase (ribokinase family)